MTRRIRADVFPARVSVTHPNDPAQTPTLFDKARLIVTTDTVYVYQDSPSGPELVYTERLASYDAGVPVHRRTRTMPAREASAVTDSGAEVTFARASGCGCGSRLKYFDPWSAQLSTAASTRDA
jgi:hypothetical protein